MAGEEGPVAVRVKRGPAVAELELPVAEVREAGAVVRREVHREAAHLARPGEERAAAHARQLLQPPLLRPLVLEPNLRKTREKEFALGKSRRGRSTSSANRFALGIKVFNDRIFYALFRRRLIPALSSFSPGTTQLPLFHSPSA